MNLNLEAIVQTVLNDLKLLNERVAGETHADTLRRAMQSSTGRTIARAGSQLRSSFIDKKGRLESEAMDRRAAMKEGLAGRIGKLQVSEKGGASKEKPPRGRYAVVGQVTESATGDALPGVRVAAFDRDVIHDDRLGDDVTDASGSYRIEFGPEEFQERGEGEPEVYVSILNQENDTVETSPKWTLGRSRDNLFTINVEIDAGKFPEIAAVANFEARARQMRLMRLRQREANLDRKLEGRR
jgi:hypothetical protein